MDPDYFDRWQNADRRCKALQTALSWAKADATDEAARVCDRLRGSDAWRCRDELRAVAKRLRDKDA